MQAQTSPHTPPKAHVAPIGNDHERTDAHAAPLVQFLFWLAVLCVASFYGMKLLLGWFKAQDTYVVGNQRNPMADERVIPPEPRLETLKDAHGKMLVHAEDHTDVSAYFTSQSVITLRANEAERLSTYGWIDKQQQIVHVPIDKAIEITLKKGLPVAEKK